MMRAIVIDEWGGRDAMREADVDAPPVGPDFVLIRNRAAGVNPVDTKIREGRLAGAFPAGFPLNLGWDAAGVVEQVGPAVTMFRPGDAVFAYCRRHHLQYGTYAELTSVPDAFVAHKPESLSWDEAAALPLAGLTAHQALETLGVRGGEKLLVMGGAGGVGHLAVQIAVARGAHVIATASPANHDFLRELGADPLDYHDDDLPARVRELTGDGGADAALDLFGGEGREQAFASLRSGGRLASIAAPPPEPRDGYEVHYIFVRPSGVDLRELAELVEAGQLRPHVAEVFPLERAADAHERIEGGHVRGKLVLSVPAA
jgi:NADPH:quinone reductase-like Zn-dependent oxidoreductase